MIDNKTEEILDTGEYPEITSNTYSIRSTGDAGGNTGGGGGSYPNVGDNNTNIPSTDNTGNNDEDNEYNEDNEDTEEMEEYTDAYVNYLKNSFGFSNQEANLIRMLYDKVDTHFTAESFLLKAWKCARLLSEFSYDYYTTISGVRLNRWDDVAGSITTEENRKTYFINTLCYTESEYTKIQNGLLRNHEEANSNQNIIDFTHMQYALAARLAYTLNKDGFIANLGCALYTGNFGIYSDEDISYLAGWLGDAVLTNIYGVGVTSFGNDDYMSDLDAENIYRLILQGNSSIDAINTYYSQMTATNTRAYTFLQNISYNTVKEKVFYELIDAELYLLMSNASNQGDIFMTNYYLNLINDEQYHFNTIKSSYPDTYDFLKSLNDYRSTMAHYQ